MTKAVEEMETTLGIKRGFLTALVNEDDWSFVIKLHALVEAALTHILTLSSARPEMESIYARLDTSDPVTGKIAFASKLGLLTKTHVRFICELSKQRNKLVHDIRNVGSTLQAHVATLDKHQRRSFACDVALDRTGAFELGDKVVSFEQFVLENPKVGFWLGAMALLEVIYLQKSRLTVHAEYTALAKTIADSVAAQAFEPLKIPHGPAS